MATLTLTLERGVKADGPGGLTIEVVEMVSDTVRINGVLYFFIDCGPDRVIVRREGGDDAYEIDRSFERDNPSNYHCSCGDFHYRCKGRGRVCKHIHGLAALTGRAGE